MLRAALWWERWQQGGQGLTQPGGCLFLQTSGNSRHCAEQAHAQRNCSLHGIWDDHARHVAGRGVHLRENTPNILWESRGPVNKGDLIIQLLPVWLSSLLAGCYTMPQAVLFPAIPAPEIHTEGPRDLTPPGMERSWASVQVACATSIPVEAGIRFAPFCKAVTPCCYITIIKQFVQFLLH